MTMTLTETEAQAAQDSMPLPFFVFGTLRPECGNARTWHGLARPQFDGACTIDNHRLVGRGFPYCLPAEGETTTGCLIVPFADRYEQAMRSMDALEGVPYHYDRKTVAVTTPDGIVTAWYYIPDDWQQYADYRPVPGNDWYSTFSDDGFSRSGWWAR